MSDLDLLDLKLVVRHDDSHWDELIETIDDLVPRTTLGRGTIVEIATRFAYYGFDTDEIIEVLPTFTHVCEDATVRPSALASYTAAIVHAYDVPITEAAVAEVLETITTTVTETTITLDAALIVLERAAGYASILGYTPSDVLGLAVHHARAGDAPNVTASIVVEELRDEIMPPGGRDE